LGKFLKIKKGFEGDNRQITSSIYKKLKGGE
jgi:hypothetical protein